MNGKENIFLVVSIISTFFLAGCLTPQEYAENIVLSDALENSAPVGDEKVAARFQEPATRSSTAVGPTIELTEKYTELSKEAAELRQKNQNLIIENNQIKGQLADYDVNLKQTQKELAEANNLLIDMRVELNNWKNDILGFREELRQADVEQLRALIGILEILGGEFKTEQAKSEENSPNANNTESADSAVVSLDEPEQLALKE